MNNGSCAVQEWVTGGVVQVHKRFKWHHFQLIENARPKKEFKEGIFWKTVTLNKKCSCPRHFLEGEGHSQTNLENDVAFCLD